MTPLRFLMATSFYPPYSFGGDAVFVQALSRALIDAGHSVDVIHCVDSYHALARRDPDPQAQAGGVTVHSLRSPFGILSPLATQQTGRPLLKTRAIDKVLASKPFDVIHFHNISLLGGPGLLALGKALKLYTLHEHWLICPMHTLFRDNREVCTEKHCFRCALHYRRPPQFWRGGDAIPRALKHIDAFLSPTAFTRKLHLEAGLDIPVRILPNFHDAAPAEAPQGPPYFLYAGRLERLKGVFDLIEAFRHSPATLRIAGEGAEERSLKRAAQGCNNIEFLGHRPHAELAALFAGAIAVIVPSLAHEVFPLVMLEAFTQGTPVIGRNRGALAEIVAESGGGILFDDVAGLSAAVASLAGDRAQRERLGQAGYATWAERWTTAQHLRRYLDIVEDLRSRK